MFYFLLRNSKVHFNALIIILVLMCTTFTFFLQLLVGLLWVDKYVPKKLVEFHHKPPASSTTLLYCSTPANSHSPEDTAFLLAWKPTVSICHQQPSDKVTKEVVLKVFIIFYSSLTANLSRFDNGSSLRELVQVLPEPLPSLYQICSE